MPDNHREAEQPAAWHTPAGAGALQRLVGNEAATRHHASVAPDTARAPATSPGDPLQTDLRTEMGSVLGAVVQRAPRGEATTSAKGKGKAPAAPEGDHDYGRRLTTGPLFDQGEVAEIEAAEETSALRQEVGTVAEADKYLADSNYKNWLALPAGRRLLIATRAWAIRDTSDLSVLKHTPAYLLARSLRMRTDGLPPEELAELAAERDEQIRDNFVETLAAGQLTAAQAKRAKLDEAAVQRFNQHNERANQLLRRLFLILQQGLQVAKGEADTAGRPWTGYPGDVARALAHGGRVNVLIEIPATTEQRAYDLPSWLGLTKADKRSFATHDVGGSTPETFKEYGGGMAAARNRLVPLPKPRKRYGVDVAARGMGNVDFNGDVILPNGVHGHVLLVYRPPGPKSIGVLEIGMETTAPDPIRHTIQTMLASKSRIKALAPKVDPDKPVSPVGYVHDARSTEKTANPQSSFGGDKRDKIGVGSLDTMRVQLQGDWLATLQAQEKLVDARLKEAQEDERELRRFLSILVGPTADFATAVAGPAAAAGPATAGPATAAAGPSGEG